MIFLCSECAIKLTKEDLNACEEVPIGKLYCTDCLDNQIKKFEDKMIDDLVRLQCE
jgi:hypothetical protein